MFTAVLSTVIALFLGLQGPLCTLHCLSDARADAHASASSVSEAPAPSMTPCHQTVPAAQEPAPAERGGCAGGVLDPCASLARVVAGDHPAPGLVWEGLVLHESPGVRAAAFGVAPLELRRGSGLAPGPSRLLHSTVLLI